MRKIYIYQLHLEEPRDVEESREGDDGDHEAGDPPSRVPAEGHVPVGVGPTYRAVPGQIKL